MKLTKIRHFRFKSIFILFVFLKFLVSAQTAFGKKSNWESEFSRAFQVSPLVGLHQFSAQGQSASRFAFGLGVEDRVSEYFLLKLYGTASVKSESLGSLKQTGYFWQVVTVPAFALGRFFIGPELGYARDYLKLSSGSSNETTICSQGLFSFGGNLGFDLPVSEHHSIGPDLHYSYLFPSGDQPGMNFLQAFLAFRFIF